MPSLPTPPETVPARTGIGENLPQFILLIIVNAFVGAMVGLERSILPLLGEQEFGLTSHTAILSFLLTFGVVKALTNLLAGRLADSAGRKRLLVIGWLFALPVPVLLMFARDWSWVVAANLFLGVNQGLCRSMAVIMKIDIAGPERRGLATGLNEFAGYIAVALSAFATAQIAASYGLRTAPFSLGVVIATAGLVLSAFFVRDAIIDRTARRFDRPQGAYFRGNDRPGWGDLDDPLPSRSHGHRRGQRTEGTTRSGRTTRTPRTRRPVTDDMAAMRFSV